MREFSKVSPQFWIGTTGKQLRTAGIEAQVVALYLLTSPHANMLGLYYCPLHSIAHETGLGEEGASKGLQRAIEAGFCQYDRASEVVWVMEMAAHQIGATLKPADLRVKGVQNEYDGLLENPYLTTFYEKYAVAYHMSNCRHGKGENTRPLKGPSMPHRSKEKEKEKETETETERECGASQAGGDSPAPEASPAAPPPPLVATPSSGIEKADQQQEQPQAPQADDLIGFDALTPPPAGSTDGEQVDEIRLAVTNAQTSRGTRLPAGYQLSEHWLLLAKRTRPDLAEAHIKTMAASFVDYWIAQPGQKGSKLNWLSTWLNWVRKETAPRAEPQRSYQPAQRIVEPASDKYSDPETVRKTKQLLERYGAKIHGSKNF